MKEIEVNHFTKDYGSGRGVFDVSFEVNKGEVFGFLGPNGAGKSTTIRHLMGFSKPQNGTTKILGLDSFNNYTSFMDKVGYLPGEIALPDGLTGIEFLEMMKKMKKCKDEKWINYLIDYFELDARGDTKRMSLGVKRKLAVVVAFMNNPDILILDEPTSGLDLAMQKKFIEFIKEEKKKGKTILLSSHIFSEVNATCDRIAIIKDGKLVSTFVANDLKHKQDKTYKLSFENETYKKDFINKENNKKIYKVLDEEKTTLTVMVNDNKINVFISIISKYKISDFNELKETLEDYFMSYYVEDRKYGDCLWVKNW